ncbi:MAG: preprotein translocase subunit SecE [Actinobacteria bacterium]|nr:preprotein translocase subunit SecE [Actinomycetota bacterium]
MQAKSAETKGEHRRMDGSPPRRERTSVAQFLREVRLELRRVNWPSRREVASYSLVVLVAVSLITLFIALIDQLFGQLVLQVFG